MVIVRRPELNEETAVAISVSILSSRGALPRKGDVAIWGEVW